MIYLLLSIILTSALIISFKYFEKFKINTLHGIIINYFTAAAIAFLFCSHTIFNAEVKHWFFFAIILGILFVLVFRLIATTAQQIGVSVASVTNKMSVIIPVIIAVYLYNDRLPAIKIIGIISALIAIYLTSKKPKISENGKATSTALLLPLMVFIGSGIIDAMVNYAEKKLMQQDEISIFLTVAFVSAALTGIIIHLLQNKKNVGEKLLLKSIIGGIALGIPNYFSIFCLIKALNSGVESSVIMSINNIGIVAVSAIYSFLVFHEKFTKMNWAGITLAAIAIILIAYS